MPCFQFVVFTSTAFASRMNQRIYDLVARPASSHAASCHTTAEVPGKVIRRALGLVQYTLNLIPGESAHLAVGEMFDGLLDAARSAGGNAVIQARLVTGSHGEIGPREWGNQTEGTLSTYVVAYGEAVVLADA
jgi:hypothetical protein